MINVGHVLGEDEIWIGFPPDAMERLESAILRRPLLAYHMNYDTAAWIALALICERCPDCNGIDDRCERHKTLEEIL
jgi:hypothetical protein